MKLIICVHYLARRFTSEFQRNHIRLWPCSCFDSFWKIYFSGNWLCLCGENYYLPDYTSVRSFFPRTAIKRLSFLWLGFDPFIKLCNFKLSLITLLYKNADNILASFGLHAEYNNNQISNCYIMIKQLTGNNN